MWTVAIREIPDLSAERDATSVAYGERKLDDVAGEIITARDWAVGIIGSLVGIGLFISEYARIKALAPALINYAYLLLFVIVGLLIFLWIWATKKELYLLLRWLDPVDYSPPSSLRETATILGLALVLVALLFASRDPFLFGLAFTVYNVATLFAYRYAAQQIAIAIKSSKDRLVRDRASPELTDRTQVISSALDALHSYFIDCPQTPRHAVIAFVSLFGVGLATYWKTTKNDVWGLLAYAVFLAVIIVSEAVIFLWRDERDRKLRLSDARFREMSRSKGN